MLYVPLVPLFLVRTLNISQWPTCSSKRVSVPHLSLSIRSLVLSGVGFGIGVVASVILFRSAFLCSSDTLHSQPFPRTHLAHRTLVRLRHGCCIRRLRPLIQSRARTRYPHHHPTTGNQVDATTSWRGDVVIRARTCYLEVSATSVSQIIEHVHQSWVRVHESLCVPIFSVSLPSVFFCCSEGPPLGRGGSVLCGFPCTSRSYKTSVTSSRLTSLLDTLSAVVNKQMCRQRTCSCTDDGHRDNDYT